MAKQVHICRLWGQSHWRLSIYQSSQRSSSHPHRQCGANLGQATTLPPTATWTHWLLADSRQAWRPQPFSLGPLPRRAWLPATLPPSLQWVSLASNRTRHGSTSCACCTYINHICFPINVSLFTW